MRLIILFSVASVLLYVKDPGAHCAILIKKKPLTSLDLDFQPFIHYIDLLILK